MSKYTCELREIRVDDFNNAMSKYPIYIESYRKELNDKIYQHYKFREIGFETVFLFLDRIATKMNEIMPYYNQLYKSAELEINPFINYTMKEEYKKESNYSSESSNDATNDNHSLFSDTPQTQLSGYENYATNLDQSKNTSFSKSDNKGNDFDTYVRNILGQNNLTQPQMLSLYRQTFLNIDLMIIEECNVLFMGIY